MTNRSPLITKKQVRARQIKKALAIAIPTILVIGGLVTFLVMRYFVNTAMMNSQVNFTYGDCRYRSADGEPWKKAVVAMPFTSDYSFKTGPNSIMDLLLQDRTVIRLSENSFLEIRSLNAATIDVSLKQGTLFGKIKKLFRGQDLNVRSRTVTASVRGTEFSTVGSRGYCVEGSVEMAGVDAKEEPVLIGKNMKADMGPGSGKAEKMTPDEIKRINKVISSIKLTRVLIVTRRLLFALGSAELTPAMEKELAVIYENLEDVDGTIRIIGHTDNTGESAVNRSLSLKRAESIRDFLATKGIPRERLVPEGRGDSEPIAPNTSAEGRQTNRRVEFVLDKK